MPETVAPGFRDRKLGKIFIHESQIQDEKKETFNQYRLRRPRVKLQIIQCLNTIPQTFFLFS